MHRRSGRGAGRLLLLLLCGIILGSIVNYILSLYIQHPLFTETFILGTKNPVTLNLKIITLVLGIQMHISFGTFFGVVIGLLLYFRS